jgi:hypothetical protein
VITLIIEWPVLDVDCYPHDLNWQPRREYWNGRIVRGVPMPLVWGGEID